MIRLVVLLMAVAYLSPSISYANGGPLDYSHFRKTGNIRLMHKADVSILKEDLKIKVLGDFSEIDVTYTLKNNGPRQAIQYGFPVDAYETSWGFGMVDHPFSTKNKIADFFSIKDGESELKVAFWVMDSVYKAFPVYLNDGIYGSKDSCYISRKWYTATLKFEALETKMLHVSYRIKNTLSDKLPGFSFIHRFSDRFFTYHLTPSSNWGNGIVGEFRLSIDLSAIAALGADIELSGIQNLKEEKNVYSLVSNAYDLSQADRINIRYNYSHLQTLPFIQKHRLPSNSIKSIKSSCNTQDLPHLFDQSPRTSWWGKSSDWIEIEFHRMQNGNRFLLPLGIMALNGDYSGAEHFLAHGRVRSFQLVFNDTLVFNTQVWMGDKGSSVLFPHKSVYRELEDSTTIGLASFFADASFLFNKQEYVKKIRLKILSVENSEDGRFYLSELLLLCP